MAVRTTIYVLLCLGAMAILYPILIVFGQTFSDKFDMRDNAVAPYYLRDMNDLVLKHLYSMSQDTHLLAARHRRNEWKNQGAMRADLDFHSSRPSVLAEQGWNIETWQQVAADWHAFKASLPPDAFLVNLFRIEDYYRPFLRKRYNRKADALLQRLAEGHPVPDWLPRTYPDPGERARILAKRKRLSVAIMNHEMRSDYNNIFGVEVIREGNFLAPFWRPGSRVKDVMWLDFKASLPGRQRLVIPSEAYWHFFLRVTYRKVENINAAWGTTYAGIPEIRFPQDPPDSPALRKDWGRFVVTRWPRRMLRIPDKHAAAWRAHVRRQLHKKFETREDAERRALQEASRLAGISIEQWDAFPFAEKIPADETLGRYWCEFTSSGAVPAEDMILDSPRSLFHAFLVQKYGDGNPTASPAALNGTWKTSFGTWADIPLPIMLTDYAPVRFHPWKQRLSFMTESYERVSEYIFGRGRAAWNTAVLVLISLISALTINPCAAYALSRFPLKNSTKILVFFLATMAFPPEVAMIPNFLLLRDLGLLNTFAALVLPRMANGYAIFLLKGFYDSLPQELYHAAEIDGANELQVFRMVAMPLVKPILAYIGLNNFVMTYSSFIWAFVICPKPEMWTLMVWVYDFQSRRAGNNYVLAATVLVCIPPLIVFFFANRIIMKGIVIPSMK